MSPAEACKEPFLLQHSDLPIHKAAFRGEINSLVSLISTCENIHARSAQGCTALHLAIRGDQPEAVRLLLSAGADPRLKDYVDSALQPPFDAINLAAWTGSQNAMAILIEAGLDIPGSVFERCASLNYVECMRTILEKLPQPRFSDYSILKSTGLALGRAACCWHLEAVEYILTEVKGFPNVDRREDRDALSLALAATVALEYICIDECRWWKNVVPDRCHIIMEKLVMAGVGASAQRRDEMTNNAFWVTTTLADRRTIQYLLENELILQDGQTDAGHTPLFGIIGIQDDDVALVKAFIAAGADVEHEDRALRTPMHYAANCTLVKLLQEHGADLFAKDKYGMTPLHLACTVGRLDIIEFLLSKGAIVDEAAKGDWTPLLCSTSDAVNDSEGCDFQIASYTTSTRISTAKLLLDRGANIRARTTDGQTVLHGAVELHDTELVRYLIDQGADVRATMTNGVTALHKAARATNVETVQILVDRGADIHAVTADGETVLHAACSGANISTLSAASGIIKVLIGSGIEINARNATGSTPLHLLYDSCYKYQPCDMETFNLLLRKGADKSVENNEGETVHGLVEKAAKWVWTAEGCLEEAPPPPRDTYWRGSRGRGTWIRGRGGP
jgi:ankyrin repeat protein